MCDDDENPETCAIREVGHELQIAIFGNLIFVFQQIKEEIGNEFKNLSFDDCIKFFTW